MRRASPGTIFAVAEQAGLALRGQGPKRRLCCPFHDDRHPSAALFENNGFYCSVCGSMGLREFASAVRVRLPFGGGLAPERRRPHKTEQPLGFSAVAAQGLWDLALERARDDDVCDADSVVYRYLEGRGLAEAWEHAAYGIISTEMALPESVGPWPRWGYRLVAALYDLTGRLCNVQVRRVWRSSKGPKVLAPRGSKLSGTVFANSAGLALLRGTWDGPRRVIFGEGLTDFLALTIASSSPVLCAPGASTVPSAFGPWVRGCRVLLALDNDSAGDKQIRGARRQFDRFHGLDLERITWPEGCTDATDVVERMDADRLGHCLRAYASSP